MTLSARMIIVLTTIGLISGSLLAIVGLLTSERIEMNRLKEIQQAITKVVPGTVSSKTLYQEESLTIYVGQDEAGSPLGFAVYASGTGFQDVITLMFGTDSAITKINSLTILEQKETPGLGAKITDQKTFLRFWEGKDCSQPLSLHKPAASSPEGLASAEINTITGATISSEKVLEIVNISLDNLKTMQREGKLGSEDNDGN
jgi:electron transport complex protein RnfG